MAYCLEAPFTQPGMTENHLCRLAMMAGITFDELVQWMVEDVSLGHRDRRGPKLI